MLLVFIYFGSFERDSRLAGMLGPFSWVSVPFRVGDSYNFDDYSARSCCGAITEIRFQKLEARDSLTYPGHTHSVVVVIPDPFVL